MFDSIMSQTNTISIASLDIANLENHSKKKRKLRILSLNDTFAIKRKFSA